MSLVCYGKELQKFFASPLAATQGSLSDNGASWNYRIVNLSSFTDISPPLRG
jgi:hypothetical protein